MSIQSQIDRFIDACKTGDLSCIQELLNATADLDASRSLSQIIHARDNRALQLAAENGHEADPIAIESICRLLIEHDANIHVYDDYAFRCAAENGHEAVCRLLIEHDANIHADDGYALRWAAENGHEAICRLLIEHSADIHANDDCALTWAAKKGHEGDPIAIGSICQLLLEGSDASDPDPLMARRIKPKYSKGVLRVFQAYGDHEAITEALMCFTDDQNDYIASCFISRKSAI